MASSRNLEFSLSSLKSVVQVQLQKFSHSFFKAKSKVAHLPPPPPPPPPPQPQRQPPPQPPMTSGSGHVDSSKWRKLKSRSLGIPLSMIPDSSRIVLKILQNEGYDAYLVGGCVRDLLLNKIPKDFDVVTSANLIEIKKIFHRAYIVGRKFPICRVHVKGSAIEVSSFETVAKHATEKEDIHLTEMPRGYDAKDVLRWKNSLNRDFTINSLFYDPFAQRIYDYSNGMTDLRGKKLRTVAPARLSFDEDCARILRGIRIAARLGFSFTKDTEKAVRSLHDSITTLDKARLMMELNYMLSYGAAGPSLILLKRYNILKLLLPFHAAYLAECSQTQNPVMLMKLFCNLDSVTSCDQPCTSGLWVSLLAFHLALVNNPQDAIIVWAFSSLLYHGNWETGVKAAREQSLAHVHFTPEILKSSGDVTDEMLSQRVANFASKVLDSINILTDSERLCTVISRYPSSQSVGLVLISHNVGREVYEIFNVMTNDIESLREKRSYYNIDYSLLGKGDISEIRFALGKIITDTMRSGMIYGRIKLASEEDDLRTCKPKVKKVQVEKLSSPLSKLETPKGKGGAKRGRSVLDEEKHQQKAKKQKPKKQTIDSEQKCVKEKLNEILTCQDITQKKQQLKKVVVKDVKKLLSSEEVTLKNDREGPEKHRETQIFNKVRSAVGKVPEMVSDHDTQARKEMLGVVENATGITKQRMAQAPENILCVLQKVPQLKIELKDQHSKDIGHLSSLSNIFNEDKYPTKKDDSEEKRATVGDRPRDESVGVKRARKLSSLFK